MKRSGKKINADRVVSLSAMFVSVGTLFVIIFQTNLIYRSERASMMPYLQLSMGASDSTQTLRLHNAGVGPALIKSVKIVTKDSIFLGDPFEYFMALKGQSEEVKYYNDLLIPGRLVPANSGFRNFQHSIEGKYGDFIASTFRFPYNAGGFAVIEIEYESIYGNRWKIRSDEGAPKQMY